MKNKTALLISAIALSPLCSQAEQGWDFKLSPYLWFAGVEGDVSTLPGSPVVPIDISPSEALSDNEASLMLAFEAKKQQHGVLIDFIYTDTQSDTSLVEVVNLNMKSTSKNTLLTAAYVYEFYNQDQSSLDFFGGFRYWDIETILEFEGGLGLLAGTKIKNSEDWFDPFVGVKGRTSLGDTKFYAAGWVGAGGFGVGSDMFYDISANIGYQWNEAIGTTLGYRVLDVDYEDGSFVYDIRQPGWILGLTWAF